MRPGRGAAARARRLGPHRPGGVGDRGRARVRGHAARARATASRPRRSSWSTRATATQRRLRQRAQAAARALRDARAAQPRSAGDRRPADVAGCSTSSSSARRRRSCAGRCSASARDCAHRVQRRRGRRADRHGGQDAASRSRCSRLDTGRLHPETYRFIDACASTTASRSSWSRPSAARSQPFVRKKGLFSFYEDGHQECCGIRKVEPLRRALARHRAWMTGQRRDQSPDARARAGRSRSTARSPGSERARCSKFNPLAELELGPDLGVHPRARRALQRAARARLRCRSAASRARARRTPASTSARAAGGGKKPPSASAACHRRGQGARLRRTVRARLSVHTLCRYRLTTAWPAACRGSDRTRRWTSRPRCRRASASAATRSTIASTLAGVSARPPWRHDLAGDRRDIEPLVRGDLLRPTGASSVTSAAANAARTRS